MSAAYQAVNIKAPVSDGTNPTNVRYFTVTNASLVHALPGSWAGKYVFLYNEDAVEVEFFFTKNAAAVIGIQAATAAGQAAPTLGGRLRASSERHVRIPDKQPEETIYFARVCGTTANVRLELASD